MNRRSFFKWLGAGSVAVVVAPSALFTEGPACVAPPPFVDVPSLHVHSIGDYAEYTNFSQFAIDQSIDAMTKDTAAELSYRAGLSWQTL